MACPYYIFRQNDYFCYKKDGYINHEVYQRYCKNYDYANCPIYQREENKGCYITTACIAVLGCADDGEELTLLRTFRDTYMNQYDRLRAEIQEYYEVAPKIVERINAQNNFYEIYRAIFETMIVPCMQAIQLFQFDEAYQIYKSGYLK